MASFANSRRPPQVVRHSRDISDGKLPMYGLDKELADRQAAKRDGGLESQCLRWIEAVLEEPVASEDLIEALKDGVQLCKLINAISPGSVRKINTSRMPFKQRENISNFLRACRKLGQSEHTLFTTADLFERGNHVNVVNGLYAFGSVAQKVCPAAPRFGTKLATKQAPVSRRKKGDELHSTSLTSTCWIAHSLVDEACVQPGFRRLAVEYGQRWNYGAWQHRLVSQHHLRCQECWQGYWRDRLPLEYGWSWHPRTRCDRLQPQHVSGVSRVTSRW